jgi:hypothetical protein
MKTAAFAAKDTTTMAKPPTSNVSDGSVTQAFLRLCEETAIAEAGRFLPNCKAGATVSAGQVTVEVRAYEGVCLGADISVSGVFTPDNTVTDMRNYWGQAVPQGIVNYWGSVRLDTTAPLTTPTSDVEPEPPAE